MFSCFSALFSFIIFYLKCIIHSIIKFQFNLYRYDLFVVCITRTQESLYKAFSYFCYCKKSKIYPIFIKSFDYSESIARSVCISVTHDCAFINWKKNTHRDFVWKLISILGISIHARQIRFTNRTSPHNDFFVEQCMNHFIQNIYYIY